MGVKIFIAVGEESGDILGASLADALRELHPTIAVRAMGGGHLAEAGAELIVDVSAGGTLGLSEVLSALPRYLRMLARMRSALVEETPTALIAIDNFGFNHCFCSFAHRMGVPVFYFSPPKVWAWGAFRGRWLARYARRVYALFPFEAEFLQRLGVSAFCFGHPLAERLSPKLEKEEGLVAILPGSRRMEVENLLPDMLGAAKLLKERMPELRFVLGRARSIDSELVDGLLSQAGVDVVVEDDVHRLLGRAYVAMVASGTATLESALLATPMVIVYRTAPLTALAARLVARIRVLGLPNHLAGRMIVPELLQSRLTAVSLARQLWQLINDRGRWRMMQEELIEVTAPLREMEGSVSLRVAEDILRNLQSGAD